MSNLMLFPPPDDFELARIEGRARRPYLAVWIEDKDKFPLRTLALWLEKTRWLPDLKVWYSENKMRSMAEGRDITKSVSSATRRPGKYTLKWDGKTTRASSSRPASTQFASRPPANTAPIN